VWIRGWLILGTDVLRGKFISDVGVLPSLEDEQRRERVVRELGKVIEVRVLGLRGFILQCWLELMFLYGDGCCR